MPHVLQHTRSRREGVGRAEHDTAGLDGVKALPDHRDDGASSHVLDEAGEEGLALEVSVVCIGSRFVRRRAEETCAEVRATYASRGAPG